MRDLRPFVLALFALAGPLAAAPVRVTVDAGGPGKAISPDLVGVFFEDINYAADGGLYAELVQNRSFEYKATEQPTWNALTSWELVTRGGGKASWWVDDADALHPNNPHHLILQTREVGGGVGIANAGFGGMVLEEGARYEVSVFAKHLHTGDRWSRTANEGEPAPLVARFETADGAVLGEAGLGAPGRDWTRLSATVTATRAEKAARLLVLSTAPGGVALDVVSAFPQKTFRNRRNGLRADIAQAIADLKPKFVRFPGGCLVHGNGLGNMYRWKDTIGPVERRKAQANIWRYHQTGGLGYFEYFQFCEDVGATPLPVVPAAVSCQNSAHKHGIGQQALPLEQMDAYVQEVLDLVEYANGPVTSTWGAERAAAGHPEPFGLRYLGVGNEDRITPAFKERFARISQAVKARHPEITVIGTVGPFWEGEDFDLGWAVADELRVPMVDEHYYVEPEWFLKNTRRYETYDRKRSHVYLGEYASRGNKWANALAEAAYLTGLERNADVVRLASYAPLLGKVGNTQWNPNLIYFTNTGVFPTVNYYVQQLFSANAGDASLAANVAPATPAIEASAVRETKTGDLILKIVNTGAEPAVLSVDLQGAPRLAPQGSRTVLSGALEAANTHDTAPSAILRPVTSPIAVRPTFDCDSPAHSLTVLRLPAKGRRTPR